MSSYGEPGNGPVAFSYSRTRVMSTVTLYNEDSFAGYRFYDTYDSAMIISYIELN